MRPLLSTALVLALAGTALHGQGSPASTPADSITLLSSQVVDTVQFTRRAAEDALRLDIPVLDAPYNLARGVRGPSMAQSLAVTESFYELSHLGIQGLWGRHRSLARLSVGLFDILVASYLPAGDAWLHEEFHRAVMGNRGIDSFNDVYDLDFGAETIAVSHVDDADLVRLKAEHPAEQARLGVAGIEGEYLLVQRLQRNRFFHGSRGFNLPLYWFTKANSALYVWSGHTAEADTLTDEMNVLDGADVEVRDFTGHDFTAWAYDLHRPAEPYGARGVHPSGVGIDRYVKPADLTEEERAYLKRQGKLQRLNFLDPALLGIHGITVPSPGGGPPLRLGASAGHVLTSFGHTVDMNLFLKRGDRNLFVVLHRYENGARAFPGLDAELIDLPVELRRQGLLVSPRLALWMQPAGQGFRTREGKPGALAALRVVRPGSSRWGTFLEVEAKTAGWVAGNVSLDPNLSVRLGGSVVLD
jgi:hypothetical protein